MSDHSSESSEEWILLNECDTDLSSDDIDQSLNLELSYNSVCNAVSDSIRSSLSSEELEWQYENFIIPDYSPSYIEDVNLKESDVEGIAISNASHIDDDVISNSDLISDLAPVSKIRCYKHERNDNLNFILNVILALVISSAFGLGIGHFWGWSHKCYTKAKNFNKATAVPDILHDIVIIKQIEELKDVGELKKRMISPLRFTENLLDSISSLNLKDTSISSHLTASIQSNKDNITEANLPEIFKGTNVLELKNQEATHFPGIGFIHIPNVPTDDIPKSEVLIKSDSSNSAKVSSVHLNHNLFYINEEKRVELEFPNELHFRDVDYFKKLYLSEEMSSGDVSNLLEKNKIDRGEFKFSNEMHFEDASLHKESNLTNQLADDLNQVIQSLSAIALARLNNFNKKYPIPIEDSNAVIKLYIDFQNLINTKITDINNVILSAEFRLHEKSSLKYLQKMVYSLVDSVDYLMKVTFKILSKRNKRVNVNKICNDISRVIFNFNKKWEKNCRFWDKIIEKAKLRILREKSFEEGNKHFKKRAQFEKGNSRRYTKLRS